MKHRIALATITGLAAAAVLPSGWLLTGWLFVDAPGEGLEPGQLWHVLRPQLLPSAALGILGMVVGALLTPLWLGGLISRSLAAVLTPLLVLFGVSLSGLIAGAFSGQSEALLDIFSVILTLPMRLLFSAMLLPALPLCWFACTITAWSYGQWFNADAVAVRALRPQPPEPSAPEGDDRR